MTVCPGSVIWIVPAHWQLHVLSAVSAGLDPIVVAVAPGDQGAVVIGTQGCGVKTPMAAAVAAATWGLDGDWHMPNDAMFTLGL